MCAICNKKTTSIPSLIDYSRTYCHRSAENLVRGARDDRISYRWGMPSHPIGQHAISTTGLSKIGFLEMHFVRRATKSRRATHQWNRIALHSHAPMCNQSSVLSRACVCASFEVPRHPTHTFEPVSTRSNLRTGSPPGSFPPGPDRAPCTLETCIYHGRPPAAGKQQQANNLQQHC